MIWEELKPSIIYLDLDVKNTDELFEKMGSKLVEEGFAKESYVQALKDREAEFPTGLEMDTDGLAIALPHTAIEHVNKAATSIAILKKPIEFHVMGGGVDDTCQVSLVFMLCVDDPNAHLDGLQAIVQILQDKNFLKNLDGAKTPEEVINLFKSKEEELCQKK